MNNEQMNGGQMSAGGMQNGMANGGIQMQQGMMPSLKPPMSPEKKKKLIMGISLGVGGLALLIAGIIVAVLMLKVEYGESYKIAKELRPKISDLGNNYDCSDVVEDVASTYVDVVDYEDDVTGCLTASEGVSDLVVQLGKTSGVKRDKEVKAQFERFEEALNTVLPDRAELEQRLNIYLTWHKFVVAVDNLTMNSADAEVQNVAKILTDSGNEIFAKYGAGWAEKAIAYRKAYRAWDNASYSAKNYSELRQAKDDARTDQVNWISENKPDIKEVGGLEFKNNSKMADEFNKLYNMIVEQYEQNYDGSGECTEFLGEVFCD